ncbi:MAG: hypothetical protein HRU23_02840 [Gammaproteobacteria bacterium]|nr:hypothetical protein [Gammaproteobacteria bacterium]
MYNMVASSALQLKIPLLFFVIESFFSDVQSEVSFRVPLYITNLLNEDDNFRGTLKKLYDVRSKVAHGDLKEADKIISKLYKNGNLSSSGFSGATIYLDNIVNRLWIRLLDLNWNPAKSAELITPYLIGHKNN